MHYFTTTRPKQHMSPGLFFDKVKYSFAGRKLHYMFHPYHVKFKHWTCLNLIFEQSIVYFRDIKIKIWIWAANSIDGCAAWPDSKLVPSPLLFVVNTNIIFR